MSYLTAEMLLASIGILVLGDHLERLMQELATTSAKTASSVAIRRKSGVNQA
jgi:hypothetical protein